MPFIGHCREGTSLALAAHGGSAKAEVSSCSSWQGQVTSGSSCSILSCNPLWTASKAAPGASSNMLSPQKQSLFKHDLLNDTKLVQGTSFQPVRCNSTPKQPLSWASTEKIHKYISVGFLFCLAGVFLELMATITADFSTDSLKNSVLLQGKKAAVNRWPKRNRPEKWDDSHPEQFVQ